MEINFGDHILRIYFSNITLKIKLNIKLVKYYELIGKFTDEVVGWTCDEETALREQKQGTIVKRIGRKRLAELEERYGW